MKSDEKAVMKEIRYSKFPLNWLPCRRRCIENWAIGYKTAILHKIVRKLHLKPLIVAVSRYLPYGRIVQLPLNP